MALTFDRVTTGTRANYYVGLDGNRIGYMFKDRGTSIWCLRGPEGEFAHEPTLAQAKAVWRARVQAARCTLGLSA